MAYLKYVVIMLAFMVGVSFACPKTPTEQCDFYFNGTRNVVPTYPLFQNLNDTVLSRAVFSAVSNQRVLALSSNGNCSFVGVSNKKNNCYGKFYFGSAVNPIYSNRVISRVFQPGELKNFKNRCVKIKIATAAIRFGPKAIIYLNPQDKKKLYPEARRCVVFRTK